MPLCAQWKDVDLCDVQEVCDFGAIFNSSHPSTAAMIKKVFTLIYLPICDTIFMYNGDGQMSVSVYLSFCLL